MLRRATSRKRLQGIFWQNAGWCQDERAHGIRKGSLLVSCSQFIFGEGIRGSDFQSRTLARRSIEFSVKQLSCDLKRQAESMGFEPTWPLRPHDLANRPDKTVFDYFPFSQARPQGFEPRPTCLESVMLPLHQGRGVFDSVFGV